MKLNWKRFNETTIEAKTCLNSVYTITYCEGKTFTSDARFIPNGYFKLTRKTPCLASYEMFISPAEDGIELVKQNAQNEFDELIKPYMGKRRIEVGRDGGLWIEFDYEFGVHTENDVAMIEDATIEKVNKLLKDNGIHAHFSSWDSESENIGYKLKNSKGEIVNDWDTYDIYSLEGISNIKTNEELGIPDLE